MTFEYTGEDTDENNVGISNTNSFTDRITNIFNFARTEPEPSPSTLNPIISDLELVSTRSSVIHNIPRVNVQDEHIDASEDEDEYIEDDNEGEDLNFVRGVDVNTNFVRDENEMFVERTSDISVGTPGDDDYAATGLNGINTGRFDITIAPARVPTPIPEFIPTPANIPHFVHHEPFSNSRKQEIDNFIGLNYDLIKDIVTKHEESGAENVELEDEENLCGIGLDKLLTEDFYYKCTKCNKITGKDNLKSWLMKQGYAKSSCPYCREPTPTYPKLFINK